MELYYREAFEFILRKSGFTKTIFLEPIWRIIRVLSMQPKGS